MKSRPKNPAHAADFEAIYERHSREVWALVYARWLNADMALDIMQEAFLRLWKQWQEGERIVNPRAWLLRVARNLAEDHAKSSLPPQRHAAAADDERRAGRETRCRWIAWNATETFGNCAPSWNSSRPADREILTLRYALDYDASEIADMLEINATAVHMRLSRARQRLAERLRPRESR